MTSLPLFRVQLTWTAQMALTAANLKHTEEVVVSYLPLSHVAAQMIDMWMCMCFAFTTYFAEPDALKVRTQPLQRHGKNNKAFFLLFWFQFHFTFLGLFSKHNEGGSSNLFHGGSSRVGEDAGEDESCRCQGNPNEEESGRLGQVHRPAVQLQCNEWVRRQQGSFVRIQPEQVMCLLLVTWIWLKLMIMWSLTVESCLAFLLMRKFSSYRPTLNQNHFTLICIVETLISYMYIVQI